MEDTGYLTDHHLDDHETDDIHELAISAAVGLSLSVPNGNNSDTSRNVVYSMDVATGLSQSKLPPKKCEVCGDAAFGRNFGVPSCESCKAFFRRNMHKDSLFGRCDGKCDVTVISRTHCKKCRLNKCYNVGMKRELIKKVGTEKNEKRQSCGDHKGPDTPPDSNCGSSSSPPHVKELSSNGSPVLPLLPQTYGSSQFSPISPVLGPPFYIKTDIESLALHEVSIEEDKINDALIANLLSAYDKLMDDQWVGEPPQINSEMDFVNLIERPTRQIVKLAKSLNLFKTLTTDDQIALLKGGVMELTWIMATLNFDPNNKQWIMKDGTNVDHKICVQPFNQGPKVLDEMIKKNFEFSCSLLDIVCGDRLILKLLIAISLFSSDRSNLVDIEGVQKIQEKYAVALHRYTRQWHPYEKSLFARAMQKLVEIREISEKHTKMLLSLNVGELKPLIVEVFDLEDGS